MKCQKIINLLDTKSDDVAIFTTKKWIDVHDPSGRSYNINNQTSILRSNLCD